MSKSELARLRIGRSMLSGPKENPRTGLLFNGDDYIINKETDRAELVNKHFVRKDMYRILKSDEDNELV